LCAENAFAKFPQLLGQLDMQIIETILTIGEEKFCGEISALFEALALMPITNHDGLALRIEKVM